MRHILRLVVVLVVMAVLVTAVAGPAFAGPTVSKREDFDANVLNNPNCTLPEQGCPFEPKTKL